MYPLENLKLSELSEKLVILLALVTGHRKQTIAFIRLSNMKKSSSGIEIEIPQKVKNSGPEVFQPLLILPRFVEKPELCVVRTLESYITTTAKFRKDTDELFILTREPYKAASKDTISRWLRAFLVKCGITDFAPHSLRHASTLAAMKKGIRSEMINSLAGWSERLNVFNRFYNRPIVDDRSNFAKAVVLKEKIVRCYMNLF